MSDVYKPTGGPSPGPTGVWIAKKDVLVRARGAAFSKGDVVVIDPTESRVTIEADSEVTTAAGGTITSLLATITTPTADAIDGSQFGIFGVCLEDIADEGEGEIRIQGPVDEAFVQTTTGTLQNGSNLVPTTAKNLDGIGIANEQIVAYINSADADIPDSTPTARTLTPVMMLPPGWYRQATTGFAVT
jgi:hypothetical protein